MSRTELLQVRCPGSQPRFGPLTGLAFVACLVCVTTIVAQDPPQPQVRASVDEDVAALLKKLKQLQDDRQSGQDPWARTIKELIELGPDAVPALSRALIATPMEERRMLRSIPFVLRGIGDQRAVPALIQTLPKCNAADGSDMGYNTNDPELLAFMRKHDDDLNNSDPDGYNWGRPINEVRTALNKLTGTEQGEIELCHIHGRDGTPRQRYLKQLLFMRCAERWAEWWEDHWRDYVSDEAYAKVELPEFQADGSHFELKRDAELVVDARMSNMMCEPLLREDAQRMFYDLDTGRYGSVHKRWIGSVNRGNERIICKWAVSEGYDLMGSQIEENGKTVFVLRLLDGEAWEVPFDHWKKERKTTAESLIKEGRPTQKVLAIHDAETGKQDYDATGLFFVITSHGTPCFVRLGVAVYDTTIMRGQPLRGDNELNPKGFRQGRRFGIRLLKEAEGG